jgi:hypothetical protein
MDSASLSLFGVISGTAMCPKQKLKKKEKRVSSTRIELFVRACHSAERAARERGKMTVRRREREKERTTMFFASG